MVTYIMPCPVVNISIVIYACYQRKSRLLPALLTVWGRRPFLYPKNPDRIQQASYRQTQSHWYHIFSACNAAVYTQILSVPGGYWYNRALVDYAVHRRILSIPGLRNIS